MPPPPADHEQPWLEAWPGFDPTPKASAQATETAISTTVVPTGRVLPALNEAVPPAAMPEVARSNREGRPRKEASQKAGTSKIGEMRANDQADPGLPAARDDETDVGTEAEAALDVNAAKPVDIKAVASTLVLRQGRKRLSREEFGRGDRWKARLPAAVHRAGAQRGD